MEEIVDEHVKQIIACKTDICHCPECQEKIVAEVLSKVPAKYITSETGAMYTMIEQIRVEQASVILRYIMQAIENLEPHS
jgi:uncharacterized protein YqgV (UPF0045/DUF77 family)